MIECINTKCDSSRGGKCILDNKDSHAKCVDRKIKTPNYAEEQLEHAKNNHCYNKKCQENDQNGYCMKRGIECDCRMVKCPKFYEEEYKKIKGDLDCAYADIETYKKENDSLKNENATLINKLGTIDAECQEEITKLNNIINYTKQKGKEWMDKYEEAKKETEEGYQAIETEYGNKLFIAEQKAKETIDSLMLVNDKYIEKQKAMEADLIKYKNIIKEQKATIKSLANLL